MSEGSSAPSRPASAVGDLPNLPQSASQAYRFNWEPHSRRGPGSVSETTEGRGDYFGVSPKVDLYNEASSSALVLPTEWSSSRHGFHAISTVLNSPHKKQAPPKAHSKLQAVVPVDLPRVKRKDFDSYFRAIGPEYSRLEQNMQLGLEGIAQLDGTTSVQQPNRFMPSLDTVPSVFFERPFKLGDSRTFAQVTEECSILDADQSDISALGHALPLLDKLEHYADTIEQHLVAEIKSRSSSFFAALTNLQDLQVESEQCLSRISSLRSLLKDVDEKSAKRGLDIVRLEAKLRNVGSVKSGVESVKDVVALTTVARDFVSSGQWSDALDVVEDMDAIWNAPSKRKLESSTNSPLMPPRTKGDSNGRRSPLPPTPESPPAEEENDFKPHLPRPLMPFPLSSLNAFSSLPEHLKLLKLGMASTLTIELVSLLQEDLNKSLEAGSGDTKGLDLRDAARPLLSGLSRTGGTREATLAWREVVLLEVAESFGRQNPLLNFPDRNEIQSQVDPTHQLQAMSHSDFLGLMRTVYHSLLLRIERIQSQNLLLADAHASYVSTRGGPPQTSSFSSQSSATLLTLKDDLLDLLASACELSNTQAAKVVSCRAEQHSNLSLREFLAFFKESWDFLVKCEVICRRMIVGLRGVVVGQAKVFLQSFHQSRISESAKLVEDEQWNPAEILPALQRLTNIIVDSAVQDSPELAIDLSVEGDRQGMFAIPAPRVNGGTAPLEPSKSSPVPSAFGSTTKINGTGGKKQLKIEDKAYFAVSATTTILVLLLDYLRVIVNLPLLTTDTMAKVIEFLRVFNSRTCQVVLGAGAMRSAGLRNITAKHLALASQSLSIMIALIPYIRETFRRHLSATQAVMLTQFDSLKRDYQEHQNKIHDKLIVIMGDRLTEHIKTLKTVDWANNATFSEESVNGYMEVLVKETVTLHKVLSRYLTVPVVEYVMTQVFAKIDRGLSEEYATISLPSQNAKDRLLADARFMFNKFSALKNVGAPTSLLVNLVTDKDVASDRPAPRRSSTINLMGSSTAIPSNGLNFRTPQTANERIRGLLSRSTSAAQTPPPTEEKAKLPSEASTSSTATTEARTSTSSRPSTPRLNGTGVAVSAGYRQINVNGEAENSLKLDNPLPSVPALDISSIPPPPPPPSDKPTWLTTPTHSRPGTPRIPSPAPPTLSLQINTVRMEAGAALTGGTKLDSPLPSLPIGAEEGQTERMAPPSRPRSPLPPVGDLGLPEPVDSLRHS